MWEIHSSDAGGAFDLNGRELAEAEDGSASLYAVV